MARLVSVIGEWERDKGGEEKAKNKDLSYNETYCDCKRLVTSS